MAIIKCRVYKNNEKWGGGLYFVPKEHVRAFENLKIHDISAEGEFQFDQAFLDQVIGQEFFDRTDESKGHYYDNTWCE